MMSATSTKFVLKTEERKNTSICKVHVHDKRKGMIPNLNYKQYNVLYQRMVSVDAIRHAHFNSALLSFAAYEFQTVISKSG